MAVITAAEVAAALRGSWRLFRLDPGGLDEFDRTIEGFWRSFWVAVILIPAYLLKYLVDDSGAADQGAGTFRFVAIEAIAYVIGWVAYPLLMFHVTEWIDRSQAYVGYIVAYNWSHLIQMAIFLPALILMPGDPAAGEGSPLLFLATLVTLFYLGYIAKVALDIPASMAAGLVFLDLLLSFFITSVTRLFALPL